MFSRPRTCAHRSRENNTAQPDHIEMHASTVKMIGTVLICISLFIVFAPFAIVGYGTSPSTQIYQNAKGSWLPQAFAYAHPAAFFYGGGVVFLIGLLILLLGIALDRRSLARYRKLREKIKREQGACTQPSVAKAPSGE